MAFPSLGDVEGEKIFKVAKDFYVKGDYVKALEVIEDLSSVQGRDKSIVCHLQGTIFSALARKTENTDVKFTYFLSSVEIFSPYQDFSALAADSLFQLAQQTESTLYYRESLRKAKQCLHVTEKQVEDVVKHIIETAQSKIAESKKGSDLVKDSRNSREQEVNKSVGNEEETRKSESALVKGLKSYWAGLNVEQKRDFIKVSIADFESYVERLYGTEGRDAFETFLSHAGGEVKKWRFFLCRICSKKFFRAEECKKHFEEEHGGVYRLRTTKNMAQSISKDWGRKISARDWEPVDAVAAVNMIKNQLEDVKAFAYVNGWSRDWPFAADEDRSKLLQEIRNLLVSFWDRKILSGSVRDWVMHFVFNQFGKLEVSKDVLSECHLADTPQGISFLGCSELNHILEHLRKVKCERNDGTDLVCRAVDSFYSGTQVKENIAFDLECLNLLLDKRLLQRKIDRFDNEGTISFVDPDAHYAKAQAHGNDILSWLTEPSSEDERFRFPSPIRAHNFDIWSAVLRAVQYTCRTLAAKYVKKSKLRVSEEFLIRAEELCKHEDERRMNIPEDQWNRYASLLCNECEKDTTTVTTGFCKTRVFFSVVRDLLEGASKPVYDYPDSQESLNAIRERRSLSDDVVLKSLDHLTSVVTRKVSLIGSKILLIENSRICLLEDLTRLSVFDYRSYILRPLKEFLLDKIVEMESKATIAALEADILPVEKKQPQSNKKRNKSNKADTESKAKAAAADVVLAEEKKPQSKKKKNKSKKRTSTSMPSPLDKTFEQEESGNVETEGTSLTPKAGEDDSMEPDNTLSSEMGRVEISSNSDNQEEAAKDMQNMPGEDSLPKHLEPAQRAAAIRYNSTLDMTLKALCNIKVLKEYLALNRHQFAENLEDKVPYALGNFFTAFLSKEIKEDGLYGCLLEDLLASLEEIHSMSSDAAELLVSILEFWPCWKSPEIESVVTRLFSLEEYERMSCSKCRKTPNCPAKSSYRIVVAADAVRDLKCAFGNRKFEDILKLIRMDEKMLCDIGTGGCGKENFVHHVISKSPPIFTIVLEWEKDETEKEISETVKALAWEIDISRLYEGLEPNKKYRLVSMVGCGPCGEEEEEEHICLAYKKNRWVRFRRGASGKEVVGNWTNVVRFCGERKLRLKILFYEAFSK